MLERLKRAVVESYVGAIALGWLLAQGIWTFANVFAAPVGAWISRKVYSGVAGFSTAPQGFPFEAALPELVRSFFLLLLWYLLLRWLYFKPVEEKSSEPPPDPEETAFQTR